MLDEEELLCGALLRGGALRELGASVVIDYSSTRFDEVVGGDLVTSYGGRVVLSDLVDGFSTTDTISRIAG